MKKGDMIRLKEEIGSGHGINGHVKMYTDAQLKKIESLVYLENYSFDFRGQEQPVMYFDEIGVVLDMKDVYKDGIGIDVIWDRYIKILTNGGLIGWMPKTKLKRLFE